jgi:hypothetical protein
MAASYIPTKDLAFEAWDLNWSTLLTANPALYGVTAADATNQTALYTAWHTQYLLATNPSTKTKTVVAAKNAARANATAGIRPLAQAITLNNGVSNANKLALGLNLHGSTGPTPIPAPSSFPQLALVAATPGELTFKYTDSSDGVSRSKPAGVLSGLLFALASTTPITNPADLVFRGLFTKQPFAVDTSVFGPAKTVYVAAQWATRTGLEGPWSNIQAFTTV